MLKKWLIHLVVNTIVLMVIAGYLPLFHLSGVTAAIEASIILSILNLIVRPILIVLTLPVTFLTLGLFLFVINAITLYITSGIMGDSFVIHSFGDAILAAIIMAILNALIQNFIVKPIQKTR
ncbi:phage holin family protein [Pullulanibacillus sp. KACC 23026]|uniref:phage holin family protein n=1 Tax=Pullulanibacillus sp. KACC 23026 TaxID=3028315 RepID=UPI0023B201A1|nr:phage holin family protein [Pullulanibacillus sp. KACC 23026]WEG13609.1 phage holin family protein [Pullulanibacillus sp. KACC 23026]